MTVWCLVGIAVGALFASGAVPWFDRAFTWISTGSAEISADMTNWAVEHISQHDSTWGKLAAVFLAAMTPGLIALALVLIAQAGDSIRRAASGAIVALGILAFFTLPFTQALAVFATCVAIALIMWLAVGPLLVVPLVGTATALTITFARVLWQAQTTAYGGDAQSVSQLVGWPPDLWRYVLLATAVFPFLIAAFRAVFGRDPHPHPEPVGV